MSRSVHKDSNDTIKGCNEVEQVIQRHNGCDLCEINNFESDHYGDNNVRGAAEDIISP